MTRDMYPEHFFASAVCENGACLTTSEILEWFQDRQAAHQFSLQQIPFSQMDRWSLDDVSGNLCHESGKFFSIEGIRVHTNWGSIPTWDQPVINQPEIGYLGFITHKINGILHFLVQAKMEPGNINMIQLSPTLQATRSNFNRVHQGRTPLFLEYFLDRSRARVIVDSLQSEQGARFLRKRNRNIIVEVEEDLAIPDDYCWVSLGQILQLMRYDNMINMDARTVISCIPFQINPELCGSLPQDNFSVSLRRSFQSAAESMHSNEEIISWFTELKFRYDLTVERISLSAIENWENTGDEIRHVSGRFFRVIACHFEADCREVAEWSQPLIQTQQQGLIAFVVREFNGVLHFLVQGKVEPGNFDVVEMAPTVQCITGSYEQIPNEKRPHFVNYVLQLPPEQTRFDTLQSEEGGRFFREANRNMIVEADRNFPNHLPDNFIWMTANQLKEFIKYNNFVNVQARSLLSSLSFF